jgi:hypothetical protein
VLQGAFRRRQRPRRNRSGHQGIADQPR